MKKSIRERVKELKLNDDETMSYFLDEYSSDQYINTAFNIYFEAYSLCYDGQHSDISYEIKEMIIEECFNYIEKKYNKPLQVGDVVRVVSWGDRYEDYLEWFNKNNLKLLKDKYVETNNQPVRKEQKNLQYRIIAIANHTRFTDVRPLVLVSDMLFNYYLLDMSAVEKWEI